MTTETATEVMAEIVVTVADLERWGPHPIFDELLALQPEGGYLRSLFGLGHLDDLALHPDAVHDPAPLRTLTHARVVSATPTGSLMLDMGPSRSVWLDVPKTTVGVSNAQI